MELEMEKAVLIQETKSISQGKFNSMKSADTIKGYELDRTRCYFQFITKAKKGKTTTTTEILTIARVKNGAFSISDSITSIEANAFSHYTGPISVVIPNSVTSIGWSAFAGCIGLTSVMIPSSVTSIKESAFRDCRNLTSITIPGSVTSIENDAFFACGSLTSVTILDGVASIGNYTFYKCDNLTSVTIPGSVTNIGDLAFGFCRRLTSITIPESVVNIGNEAFGGCRKLKDVTVEWVTPLSPQLDEWNVFSELIPPQDKRQKLKFSTPLPSQLGELILLRDKRSNWRLPYRRTLHVPVGTKALYEAADVWKDFKTIAERK
jgi:hypothetical protein